MIESSRILALLNIIMLGVVFLIFGEISALISAMDIVLYMQQALRLGVLPVLMVLTTIGLFKRFGCNYTLDIGLNLRGSDIIICLLSGIGISFFVLLPLSLASQLVLHAGHIAYKVPDANQLILSMPIEVLPILGGYMIIVAPMVEEIFYRQYLFDSFRMLGGKYVATVVVSAIFALMHFTVVQFVGLLTFAIILQIVRNRCGLKRSILIHGASNLASFVALVVWRLSV